MRRFAHESLSVSPQDIGAQLWRAVARLVCRQVNPVNDQPCAACVRYVYPLVQPFARTLLIAGTRATNNYELVGRGVEYFLDSAASHYGVVDGLSCPAHGRPHAPTGDGGDEDLEAAEAEGRRLGGVAAPG
jgi:hypothetical protein